MDDLKPIRRFEFALKLDEKEELRRWIQIAYAEDKRKTAPLGPFMIEDEDDGKVVSKGQYVKGCGVGAASSSSTPSSTRCLAKFGPSSSRKTQVKGKETPTKDKLNNSDLSSLFGGKAIVK